MDGKGKRACFSSKHKFVREDFEPFKLNGDVLYDETTFRIRGRIVDHDIPCFSYAIEEKAHINVAKDRITAMGLGIGTWLRDLKHAILTGASDESPIQVQWRDSTGSHEVTKPIGELRHLVLDTTLGQHIGYVTDLRFTDANVQTLSELLQDTDLLFIESVFLHKDIEHATRKNHLTAHQAGEIARLVNAKDVVPFHFSPRYENCPEALINEMRVAWLSS